MAEIKQEKSIEKYPIPVSIEGTKQILFQMENCICKIYSEIGSIGTGFFCKIPFYNNSLPVLITNYHVLNENDIKDNNTIKLSIYNEIKKIEIDNERKKYTDKRLDITIIEIRPNKDGINNYLEIDEKDIYAMKSIYILQYPKGELAVSYGLMEEIKDNININYYCNTEEGSSGSPILSLENSKVIGVHCGRSLYPSFNKGLAIKHAVNLFNKYNNKNEINIIYETDEEGNKNIFGDKFVKNNKNNIELIINGNRNDLIKCYYLKRGVNKIKIIMKKKITNLEYMFYDCKSLKNIEELKYIDTNDINNFSCMFYGCSSLSDLKGLENWNVSSGNNFSYMFKGCSSLSDIKELKNWNVSNGNSFSYMFSDCSSLSDIKSLQYWNVSNGNNFSCMFSGCSSLSDIKGLLNWNVSNGNNFSFMFHKCSSLSDIKELENWNVSNGSNFSCMFAGCSSLSDIKGLQKWNVSNGNNFSRLFYECSSLSDIKGLKNWNVSNGKDFSRLFYECSSLLDINALRYWQISKEKYRSMIH